MHRSPWRYLLHLLIGSYVACALLWSMPPEIPLKRRFDRFVSPTFQLLGLWQSWNMFAPTPRLEDIYVDASAELADGRKVQVNLSRMWSMSISERYRKERWRKFFNDHMRMDINKSKWPTIAAWLRADIAKREKSDVVHIELWRHWRDSKPDLLATTDIRSGWKAVRFFETPEPTVEIPAMKGTISQRPATKPNQNGVRQ